jgi:hypothetical protein
VLSPALAWVDKIIQEIYFFSVKFCVCRDRQGVCILGYK